MKQLPPLNSLRAFESAGRHLSFSQAAEELNVTTGAISQQIRTLEDFLEIKLFKRLNRSIVLTDVGQVCLPLLSEGFTSIAQAVELARKQSADEPLTITAPPSFISRWLIPRLSKFQMLEQGFDVRIDASTRLVDFVRENIDVGIRFGWGEYPELVSDYLFSFDLIPVCSPALVCRGNGLNMPSDLRYFTLLHHDYSYIDPGMPDWAMWLASVEVDDIDVSRGIRFNDANSVIEAAAAGQGVALVDSVMAAREIEAGRLVQPFEARLPTRMCCYYLVTTRQKALNSKVCIFRNWVLEESAYLRL